MKRIKLTQGKFAIIDDADFEWLSQWKWFFCQEPHTSYALRGVYANRKRTVISMHRVIMGLKIGDDKEVDHRNGNGLDNRRENLRICTRSENMQNQHKPRGSCEYQGVCWNTSKNRWMAYIMKNYKNTTIGLYKNKKNAARAYDKKAIELFGPNAKTNFPKAPTP